MSWSAADTDQSIPERFAAQAREHPDKVALTGTTWRPTFAELHAAANRQAAELLERGGPGGRVAILRDLDAPLLATALGILGAGKTAVALNASDPPARLERIRRDAAPQLVIVDERHRDLAKRAGFSRDEIVTAPARPDDSPHPAPAAAPPAPDDVAFLIYTSGSTGRPKGVMQTHRNVLHNVLRQTNGLGIRATDRVVLLAALSGGQGLATAWIALLNGATLCPFPIMDRGVTGLAGWLADEQVTVFVASASVFRHFARTLDGARLSTVRLVRLASEPAVRGDFDAYRRHFEPTCLFANALASSEVGVTTQCVLTADAEPGPGRLPVGRPAEGIEVLLLDEHGRELPPGQVGEIFVRSEYLSPGYWRDESLTEERFADDGGGRRRGRVYRTGDLAVRSPDGELTVVGRADDQVKVRGNRVELSAVEAAIGAQPGITGAVVLAATTPRGDTRLTGYASVEPDITVTREGLRSALRTTLPDHAVPADIALLDALPLTPHGKVDREALAETPLRSPDTEPGAPAIGETEELLAGLWATALDREAPGRNENFFALGGDSLTAVVVAAGVHATFGIEIELRAFAEHPTVAAMARTVDDLRAAGAQDDRPPITRTSRTEPLPLSFSQERTWRACQTGQAAGYTTTNAFRMRGPLDVEALRDSVDHIVRRHEMLRTTFSTRDGEPFQVVHPPAPVELPLIDLRGIPGADARADEIQAATAATAFDLERGPLLRLVLVQLGDEEHRLVRVCHHILSDHWSWRLFFDELAVLYEARLRGEPAPLRDDPPQYADFAVWERRWMHPGAPRYRQSVDWWRRAFTPRPEPLSLPFARAAPKDDAAVADAVFWWGLDPEVSDGLNRLGRETGATHYMVRLAVFAVALARDTGRDDIVLGAYVTTRRRAETQAMFGFFSNLTTFRVDFAGRPTFRECVARVRAAVVEAAPHTEVPYDQLSARLAESGAPVPEIRAIFGVSDRPPPMRFGGLEVEPLKRTFEHMPWGFSLAFDRWDEAERNRVDFDARLYDPAGVRAFIDGLQRLAGEAAADPDRRL